MTGSRKYDLQHHVVSVQAFDWIFFVNRKLHSVALHDLAASCSLLVVLAVVLKQEKSPLGATAYCSLKPPARWQCPGRLHAACRVGCKKGGKKVYLGSSIRDEGGRGHRTVSCHQSG